MLGLYLLSYHFVSQLRDRWQAEQLDRWTERWLGLALVGPDEPVTDQQAGGRLPRVAVDSVLSLLEAVKGEEGDRLKEALAGHGVDHWFLRRARHGHLTARLDAIEGLGKARLPHAFDPLLGLFHHGRPVVRRMAARAGQADPEEAHTTFYGLPRWVFRRAAAEITLAFRRSPQFRGLSVDDVDAYMAARP
jgi:hypothetical protein